MAMSPQIEVKSDIDHIRLRPGMYIGGTYSPDHLLQEILDNAVDELINGYADTITIDFISPGHVIITDNGRGIPIHQVKLEDGRSENSIIVASTMLKSGAKFNNDAYNISVGLHGIGLVAVNALSEFMRISVREDKKIHDLSFSYSTVQKYEILEYEVPWSTRVEFKVDPTYFTTGFFDIQKTIDRVNLIKLKFQCNIIVNGNSIEIENHENFIRDLLHLNVDHPIFYVIYNTDTFKFTTAFTYESEGNAAPYTIGDVNLRLCGGQYLTNFTTILSKAVISQFPSLTKAQSLSHLRAYVSIFMQNPTFDSQSKNNMTKNISSYISHLEDNLSNMIRNDLRLRQLLINIVDSFSVKKAAKNIQKTITSRVTSDNPLKDCLNTPGEILYIVEGESANGTLNKVRNKYTDAILPITGKILNVLKSSIDKATASKKFKYFLESLGVQIGKQQTKFRYKKIKILCDADPDGLHIVVLILFGLWKFAPRLIIDGNVSIIIPPLYGASNGKKFIPFYTHNFNAPSGYQIHRYKGIGEMNASELKVVAIDSPLEYVVKPPANKSEEQLIESVLNDVDVKRGLCIDKRFGLERLFQSLDQSKQN